MEKCGHYEHWQTDFLLVKELGIEYLRYGPPYYRVHTAPGVYGWELTDQVFNRLNEIEILSYSRFFLFWNTRLDGQFSKS